VSVVDVPVPFTLADVAASFDSGTLARGRSYAAQGRVTNVHTANSGAITARVRGSRSTPYSVVVHVAPGRGARRTLLSGSCSCPMLLDCKHVAATLCALLDARTAPADVPGSHTSAPAEYAIEGDPRIESWLQQLRETATAEGGPAATGDEQIAYVFRDESARHHERTLPVDIVVVRWLKAERWGKIRDCSPESLAAASSRAIRTEDVLIGQLMRAYSNTYRGRASLADDIVSRIVTTGRSHVAALTNPPLALGPTRPVQIVWEALEDGTQRPNLAFDGAGVKRLTSDAAWYIDRTTHTTGPLDAAVPAHVLVALLTAPPLPPPSVLAVRTTFEREFAPLALPPPAQIEERIVALEPVPTLILRTVHVPAAKWEAWRVDSAAHTIDVAELTFTYDGVTVDPQSRAPAARRLENGVSVVHPRSRKAETRAQGRLQQYPFVNDAASRARVSAQGFFLRFEPQHEGLWPGFMHRVVPELRSEGWHVEIDPSFRCKVVDLANDDTWLPRFEQRDDGWFDLGIGLDLDGRRIELLPLLRDLVLQRDSPLDPARLDALSKSDTFYLRFANDATTLAFPTARLRAIVDTLVELGDPEGVGATGRLRLPQTRANLLDQLESSSGLRWDVPERIRAVARRLRTFDGIERADIPASFHGTLRPYQRDGLDWLQFLRAYGFGGILADDMGLGKSVQTLAHLLCEKEAGRLDVPALLVVPTSLVYHWRDEAQRFAPSLRVLPLHGPERARRFDHIADSDLVITTYALLPRDTALHARRWHALILDEAQAVKNPQAKAAQVAMRLRAEHRLCLTGTPVENHLGDLWSLFSIALPGTLGDRKLFGRLFRTPIEKRGDGERARILAERIRPFLLRRTKENVAPELPEKTEIVRRIELVGAQRDLYETVRLAMHERVRSEIAARGIARSQIVILDALLKLRQVCCDPRLLPSRLRKTAESAKLELLLDMLPQMVEEGRRILLFSQFTSMLALIAPALGELGIPFVVLTGETVDRAAVVKRFQNGEVPVFLISLKAGGTGLNLTAADTVIHYDPWWNPAVERQATDRAHRIGQDRHVFVYKLIGAGTVEEKIVELQARKGELAAAIFSQKASAGARFAAEDIERLFGPLG